MNTSLEVTPNRYSTLLTAPWTRAADGLLAGVCKGIATRFGVDTWIVRALWLMTVLAFGTGILLYVVMAFCLPREDRRYAAEQKRILGVCSRISRATGVDVGLVRVASVLLAFGSFGATLVGYVVLYFILTNEDQRVIPHAHVPSP